jgi:hypothetical protein
VRLHLVFPKAGAKPANQQRKIVVEPAGHQRKIAEIKKYHVIVESINQQHNKQINGIIQKTSTCSFKITKQNRQGIQLIQSMHL